MNKAGGGGGNSCLRDYGRICTICGSSATSIAGIYAVCALLMRYYLHPNSLQWFETVPNYVPAITYSICGLLTLAFAFKRYRNFFLLKLSAYLALCNATLSSILTLSVIFVNLKVFNAMDKEGCEVIANTSTCGCKVAPFSPAFPLEQTIIFDHNMTGGDCLPPVGVAVLSFCLVVIVMISITSVFLSIFMWRLLDELID